MRIVFGERALDDLQRIEAWIGRDTPRAATRVIGVILDHIERLSVFPKLGRTTKFTLVRESVVPRQPFIVVYKLDDARDELFVIAVFHAAQDRGGSRTQM